MLLLTISTVLGATAGTIISLLLYDPSYPDIDGDHAFYTWVICVFLGGFLGLLAGVFGNVWIRNRATEQYNGLRLEESKNQESE